MDNVIVTQADNGLADIISAEIIDLTEFEKEGVAKRAARHRTEATRQAEADKAELVEAVNRLLLRSQNFMSGALRVSGLSEFREVRALAVKHGGNHVTD